VEDVMRKQFRIPILVGILALGAVQAFAQSATVVMRNGDRVQADVMDMGRNFSLRVNGQPRQVPIGDIVLFDFAGDGRNVTLDEISRVNSANGGYVVMRNGEQFNASLQDLIGKPLIAVFTNGRRANLSDVARIYTGSVGNVPGFPTQGAVAQPAPIPQAPNQPGAPANARSVVVPSNVQWTNSGFNVARGQDLRFEASGEIRLSTNGDDIGRPAGAVSGRRADGATIPSIPVGALIGRVGNGQPFPIGETTNPIAMPDNGRLFFGVNDDHVQDNSGNYVVRIWR
jgi:hypothetical protein